MYFNESGGVVLAIGATKTGETRSVGKASSPGRPIRFVAQANGAASAANGFRIEASQDEGVTWVTVAQATTAAGVTSTLDVPVVVGHYRVVFVNGAAAQVATWFLNGAFFNA